MNYDLLNTQDEGFKSFMTYFTALKASLSKVSDVDVRDSYLSECNSRITTLFLIDSPDTLERSVHEVIHDLKQRSSLYMERFCSLIDLFAEESFRSSLIIQTCSRFGAFYSSLYEIETHDTYAHLNKEELITTLRQFIDVFLIRSAIAFPGDYDQIKKALRNIDDNEDNSGNGGDQGPDVPPTQGPKGGQSINPFDLKEWQIVDTTAKKPLIERFEVPRKVTVSDVEF